jgi:hypothetical protein
VLNGVLNDLYEQPWSGTSTKSIFVLQLYNYYGTNEYWASATLNFLTLKNVIKMEEEAKRLGVGDVIHLQQ